MYTVIMKKGVGKEDLVRNNSRLDDAEQRVEHLCYLHGIARSEVVYDSQTKTFTLDASHYYEGT